MLPLQVVWIQSLVGELSPTCCVASAKKGKRGGANGNPLQYSCLGNPMARGAWWATGVTKSQTWLSNFTHSLHPGQSLDAGRFPIRRSSVVPSPAVSSPHLSSRTILPSGTHRHIFPLMIINMCANVSVENRFCCLCLSSPRTQSCLASKLPDARSALSAKQWGGDYPGNCDKASNYSDACGLLAWKPDLLLQLPAWYVCIDLDTAGCFS